MTFGLPLAFILITTLAVFLLYLLKPPANRVVVSSLLVWKQFLKVAKYRSNRLRWWLSLILASLIAICLLLSILGEFYEFGFGREQRTLLVIDNSPTMNALTVDGQTRLEKALGTAEDFLHQMSSTTKVMLSDTSYQVPIHSFLSKDEALQELGKIKLGGSNNQGLSRTVLDASVDEKILISDGVLDTDWFDQFEWVSVFEHAENVGITKWDLEVIPGDSQRFQGFIEIVNAGKEEKECLISIKGVGSTIDHAVTLAPGKAFSKVFDISDFDSGPVRATIKSEDDFFPDDNVAYGFVPSKKSLVVSLVTNGNDFLEESLKALPRIKLLVSKPSEFAEKNNVDLYVFDRFAFNLQSSSTPVIVIGAADMSWLPQIRGLIQNPEVITRNETHPVMRNVLVKDLHLETAGVIDVTNSRKEDILISNKGSALSIAGRNDRPYVWLAFDLNNSNFPLGPGFPTYLSNAIEWLVDETEFINSAPGQVLIEIEGVEVIGMDGSRVNTKSVGLTNEFEASLAGIYTASNDKGRLIRIVVNLLEESVTRINETRFRVDADQMGSEKNFTFISSILTPLTWLLLLAIILLFAEWYSYNRRKTL